jgi:hypothetical protein
MPHGPSHHITPAQFVAKWQRVDWAEVWTDTGAGQPLPAGHPLTAKRAEIEQRVLANLLRLNLARKSPQ